MSTRKATPTASPDMPAVSVLGFLRATKHTFRFDADDESAPIQSLYVQKSAFPDGNPPAVIHVGIGY